jgi:hypothetical protein
MLASIALAGTSSATVEEPIAYEVIVRGTTGDSQVTSGDPCGTGGDCTGLPIEVVFQVFPDVAPPDTGFPPEFGRYRITGAGPIFVSATATINGHTFESLPTPTDQLVEMFDEFNVSGITDTISLSVAGGDGAQELAVSANLLLGQVIDSTQLDELAGPDPGRPAASPPSSSFDIVHATGSVVGQYRIAKFGLPEPAQAEQGAAALAALALARCFARRS